MFGDQSNNALPLGVFKEDTVKRRKGGLRTADNGRQKIINN